MAKVLVTGGAGYVGTVLIPQLLADGHSVRVIDNLTFGGNPLLHFMRNVNFEFMKGDVRDEAAMIKALKGQDIIVHLAAIVGYPACRLHPDSAESVNVGATKLLTKLASKNQHIIFSSTGSNYGALEEVCTEESPLNPLSLYGQTKTLAESILLNDASVIVYRFATAFGSSPRLRLDLLINDFTYKAFNQGYLIVYEKNYMRTFIHVFDMARAIILGINRWSYMQQNVFNVGSENLNLSKEQVCQLIQKQIPTTYVHYADVGSDADQRNYVVSYDKLAKYGFVTTYSVEDGIKELIKSFGVITPNLLYTNA